MLSMENMTLLQCYTVLGVFQFQGCYNDACLYIHSMCPDVISSHHVQKQGCHGSGGLLSFPTDPFNSLCRGLYSLALDESAVGTMNFLATLR